MVKKAGEQDEALCCLVDGELGHTETQFLLRRVDHDRPLRARWERYHLARSVIHGVGGSRANPDFAGRVSAALADEAPPAQQAAPGRWLNNLARPVAGAAVAAGVAFAAYNAWLPGTTPETAGAPPATLASQPLPANDLESSINSPAASSVAQPAAGSARQPQDQAIARYLLRHTQVSAPGQRIPLIYVVTEADSNSDADDESEPETQLIAE